MFRLLVSAMFALVMVTSAEAQTPVVLPSGPGGPPVILPTPVVPTPTGTPLVTTGLLKLEGPVALLQKQFKSHGLEKWMVHSDYHAGFLIPADKANMENWEKVARDAGFTMPKLKIEDVTSIGIYSYDGKRWETAMMVTGKKGEKRNVYCIDLTGKGAPFDDAIAKFFLAAHHTLTEEAGKDAITGSSAKKGP